MDEKSSKKRAYAYIGIISVALTLMMLTGISGWYSYVFPNFSRIGTYSSSAIIVFAFFAGLASFFSPCVFGLLPGYISYFFALSKRTSNEKMSEPWNPKSPLTLGLLGAFGIFVFILVFGIIVSLLGWTVEPYLRLFSPLIGVVFIILGASLFMGYTLDMSFVQRVIGRVSSGENDPSKKVFLYGIAYAAGSAGCNTPILIALIVFSLVNGGLLLSIVTILTYSWAMGLLMVIITMLAARSKGEVINKLRVPTAMIKEASGLVLILVGVYLITLYIFLNVL